MRRFINPDQASVDDYTETDVWTIDEIEATYRGEPSLYEKYPTLDAYIDHLIETGGIVEVE